MALPDAADCSGFEPRPVPFYLKRFISERRRKQSEEKAVFS